MQINLTSRLAFKMLYETVTQYFTVILKHLIYMNYNQHVIQITLLTVVCRVL